MKMQQRFSKKWWRRTADIIFIVLVLFLLFSPGAKAWLMQQLMVVGFFKADIKKEVSYHNITSTDLSFYVSNIKTGEVMPVNQFKGKVILLNFWASWCPPCRAEMPSLVSLYHTFKNNNNIVFLFINEDDNKVKALDFLQQKGYDIPVYVPENNIPAHIFNGTLPTTILIDKSGKIILKHAGLANYNNDNFVQQLKNIITE